MTENADIDAQRARVAQLVSLGKRIGYTAYVVAMVVFVAGLATRFSPWVSRTIVAAMLVGTIVLPPAIVFGYGLKAALRHEREQGI